ncbi:MAG: DUF4249 domain-containing protein, partial [Bacteroidota bacterium]|nr:DUF4249 domain-containing protein [Bacteroidota bacterium]
MKLIILLFCIICVCSCEKNINFKLKAAADILVVDATIENGQAPMVVLSKSFDYYSNISLASLDSSFVHGADVTISNGSQSQKLVEYKTSSGGFNVYFYSIDSSNLGSSFVGKLNTTYTLKVISAGQEYDATTTITSMADKIDSIWWLPTPFADDSTETDVFIRSTDPKGFGNYIRYYTKINNGRFLPGQQSVFDDELTDGTTYDLKVTPGIDRN